MLWPPTGRIEDLPHRSGEPLSIAAMCDDGRTGAGEPLHQLPAQSAGGSGDQNGPLVDRPHYRLLGIGSRTPNTRPEEAGHSCVRTENENLRGDRRIPLQSYVQLLIAT